MDLNAEHMEGLATANGFRPETLVKVLRRGEPADERELTTEERGDEREVLLERWCARSAPTDAGQGQGHECHRPC